MLKNRSVDPTLLSPQMIYEILYKNHPEDNPYLNQPVYTYNNYPVDPYMSYVIQLNIESLNEEESIPYLLNLSEQSLYTINPFYYLNDTYIPYDTYPWGTFYPTTQASYNLTNPYTTPYDIRYDMWNSIYIDDFYNNGSKNQTFIVNDELQDQIELYISQLNGGGYVCRSYGEHRTQCGDTHLATIDINLQNYGTLTEDVYAGSKKELDCKICKAQEFGHCISIEYSIPGNELTTDGIPWISPYDSCVKEASGLCAITCNYNQKEKAVDSSISKMIKTLFDLLSSLYKT